MGGTLDIRNAMSKSWDVPPETENTGIADVELASVHDLRKGL
jgi:hypothetical protein